VTQLSVPGDELRRGGDDRIQGATVRLVAAEMIVALRERTAGRRKALPGEFGDRCDALPRQIQIRRAPVARVFHHKDDGEHDAVGGIAVFEPGASFFALMCACSIGHPAESQTNSIDPPTQRKTQSPANLHVHPSNTK
jgi:hypothetical protein